MFTIYENSFSLMMNISIEYRLSSAFDSSRCVCVCVSVCLSRFFPLCFLYSSLVLIFSFNPINAAVRRWENELLVIIHRWFRLCVRFFFTMSFLLLLLLSFSHSIQVHNFVVCLWESEFICSIFDIWYTHNRVHTQLFSSLF